MARPHMTVDIQFGEGFQQFIAALRAFCDRMDEIKVDYPELFIANDNDAKEDPQ